MKKMLVGLAMVCGAVSAQTVTYWQFQDGPAGTFAGTLDNAANPGFLVGAGQSNGSGAVKPQFSATVPGPKIYSGRYNGTLVNADNAAALYFLPKTNTLYDAAYWVSSTNYYTTAEGSYVRVTNNPALWLTNFTMECFVKIDQKSRYSLVVGMQRTALAGTGVTWGMDEDDKGGIKVRWDVQDVSFSTPNITASGFNNGLSSKPLLNDGKWHHLALTYSYTNRLFEYYVDYSRSGSANAISNLQYTATDPMLIGGFGGGSARIFNGWIDEVRYTAAVLSPDEFLTTNTITLVSDADTLYWNFESQPFVCKDFPVQTMNTNFLISSAYYPVLGTEVWSNQTANITEGKQSTVYWNTNNQHSVFFSAPLAASGSGIYTGGQLVASGKYHPTNFTVEAMVKVRELRDFPLIIGKVREASSPSFSLSIQAGNLRTRFDCYTNTPVWPGSLPLAERPVGFNWVVGSTAAIEPGIWYHVAFSYSNQVVRMYRNYQQVATATAPYPVVMTDGDFNIGNGSGERAFDGWIDEVRITPEALPPTKFLYTMYRRSTAIILR